MKGQDLGNRKATASIEINAPIDAVWSAMTDLHRYHEWNPFIVAVDHAPEHPEVGARLRLHICWKNGSRVRSWETLTRLDPPTPPRAADSTEAAGLPRSAAMAYEFSSWLARSGIVVASRLQVISQSPGQPTLYRTEESFHGLLGRLVPFGNIEDGFRRHAEALKQRVESLVAAGAV